MMDILIQKYAVCRSDMIQTFRITAYVDPKIEKDDYKTAPNFTTNNEIINLYFDTKKGKGNKVKTYFNGKMLDDFIELFQTSEGSSNTMIEIYIDQFQLDSSSFKMPTEIIKIYSRINLYRHDKYELRQIVMKYIEKIKKADLIDYIHIIK